MGSLRSAFLALSLLLSHGIEGVSPCDEVLVQDVGLRSIFTHHHSIVVHNDLTRDTLILEVTFHSGLKDHAEIMLDWVCRMEDHVLDELLGLVPFGLEQFLVVLPFALA